MGAVRGMDVEYGGSHKAENLRKRPHCAPDIAASQSSRNAQVNARKGYGGRIRVVRENGRRWPSVGLGTFSGYARHQRLNCWCFTTRILPYFVPELSGISRAARAHFGYVQGTDQVHGCLTAHPDVPPVPLRAGNFLRNSAITCLHICRTRLSACALSWILVPTRWAVTRPSTR
jgi:hypothetical protein